MRVKFRRGTRIGDQGYRPGDVADVEPALGRWLCRAQKAERVLEEDTAPALTAEDQPAAKKAAGPPKKAAKE